jgi:hypothetical protein
MCSCPTLHIAVPLQPRRHVKPIETEIPADANYRKGILAAATGLLINESRTRLEACCDFLKGQNILRVKHLTWRRTTSGKERVAVLPSVFLHFAPPFLGRIRHPTTLSVDIPLVKCYDWIGLALNRKNSGNDVPRGGKMPAVTEVLRDAQALASFSNLEPEGVEYFRRNYPDFVPQAWWDYEATNRTDQLKGGLLPPGKQWQDNQRYVREAWENHFTGGLFSVIRLVMSVFNPNDILDVTMGFDAIDGRPGFMKLEDFFGARLVTYPHQKAVLYLFEQPWRARFCHECGKRFVAAEPKNKYCGEACSHENRNRQKRDWFNRVGGQQRAARKKKNRRPRRRG